MPEGKAPSFNRRDYNYDRGREEAETKRDIGRPPKCANPERRESCRDDLQLFLTTYFPEVFQFDFSPSHIELIGYTYDVIRDGGNVCCVMPRGSGKTSILQHSLIWSALYGHSRYSFLVCNDADKAEKLLSGIKTTLETTEMLYEDFPEVIYPIRKLESIIQRCGSQTSAGTPTRIKWSGNYIQLPSTAEAVKAGNAAALVASGGITSGAFRGSIVKIPSGESIRPDCVLIDDPQSRISAESPTQVRSRAAIIKGDIGKMAAPGKKMSILMAATVVAENDLAELFLDRDLTLGWETMKVSMVQSWPSDMDLWEEYGNLMKQESNKEVEKGTATQHYLDNFEAMNEDAQLYWDARYKEGFTDALESAMAAYLEDEGSFMAEFQNMPQSYAEGQLPMVKPSQVLDRITKIKRLEVPLGHDTVTCHIDVHEKVLYYSVMSFSDSFAPHVLDFGTWPKQNSISYQLASCRQTLALAYSDEDKEGAMRRGLLDLVRKLSAARFPRADGEVLGVKLGIIDSGYKPNVVCEALAELGRPTNWIIMKGVGYGATQTPMAEVAGNKGKTKNYWLYGKPNTAKVRNILSDVNFWKSRVYESMMCDPEHTHSLRLFNCPNSYARVFADHMCSEVATRKPANGRRIDEWKKKGGQDNHYFDNVVGCYVAASVCGITQESTIKTAKARRRNVRNIRS